MVTHFQTDSTRLPRCDSFCRTMSRTRIHLHMVTYRRSSTRVYLKASDKNCHFAIDNVNSYSVFLTNTDTQHAHAHSLSLSLSLCHTLICRIR